jgi:HPt (histidine-containing phosphotransfer) domain-containing protein
MTDASEPIDVSEPIDGAAFANLVEITGGDLEFVDELVDTFIEDGRAQLDAMHAALAVSDVGALVRPAHSLKSASLNVGALRLGELCRSLEETARTTAEVPDVAHRVMEIVAGFDAVRAALLHEREQRTA